MMRAMAPPHAEPALQRLATLVTQRRVDLGMNKIDVARAATLTITTYSKIEDGLSVRPVTYGKIEPVLGWAPGTCRDILTGAPAPTLTEPTETPGAAISPVQPGDLAKDAGDSVQDAAIAVTDGLTSAQIRDLKQHVIDGLKKRGWITPGDQSS